MNFTSDNDPTVALHEVNKRSWDEFGSIHRPKENLQDSRTIDYVDLRTFDDCYVVPIALPANLHFYWSMPTISTLGFVVRSQKFKSVDEIHQLLRGPGMHYVLYCALHDASVTLRWYTVRADTDEYKNALIPKRSVTDQLSGPPSLNLSKYPHRCPKCSRPAYVGLNEVDCSGGRH